MTIGLIILLVLFAFGLGCLTMVSINNPYPKKPKQPDPEESNVILVKRNRPSFRNPGKTVSVAYDEYKTSKGLYASVKQGKGSTADEVEKK